jgi:hypothetical protein
MMLVDFVKRFVVSLLSKQVCDSQTEWVGVGSKQTEPSDHFIQRWSRTWTIHGATLTPERRANCADG